MPSNDTSHVPHPHSESALHAVLRGVAAHADAEAVAAADAVMGTPEAVAALAALAEKDPEQFFYAWSFPFEQRTTGLIHKGIAGSPYVEFIFSEYRFLEAHLSYAFKTFEGVACSADKSRWAIHALLQHFITLGPIAPDYTQEYTFHLPKKVLCTEAELLEFFHGVRQLHRGNPSGYLSALHRMTGKVE